MGQEFDRASPYYRAKAETFEAPFAGAGSLFKFGGNDSALGGFTAKELTESSAIHGDFDHLFSNTFPFLQFHPLYFLDYSWHEELYQ